MRDNAMESYGACSTNQNDFPRSLGRRSPLPDRHVPLHYRRIGLGCRIHVTAGLSFSASSIIRARLSIKKGFRSAGLSWNNCGRPSKRRR